MSRSSQTEDVSFWRFVLVSYKQLDFEKNLHERNSQTEDESSWVVLDAIEEQIKLSEKTFMSRCSKRRMKVV